MEDSQEEPDVTPDNSENEEILNMESFRQQKQKIISENVENTEEVPVPGNDKECESEQPLSTEEPPVELIVAQKFDINTSSSQNISFDSENTDSENKMTNSEIQDILKKLQDSENHLAGLKEEIMKKDELLSSLEQEKKLMEREKQMVSSLVDPENF